MVIVSINDEYASDQEAQAHILSLELSLASSLNLVVRGTRYKRTKYKGGCGKSDAIVTVTKRNLHFQNF